MERPLSLSSDSFGQSVFEPREPSVQESDWFGHKSGEPGPISRWSQSDLWYGLYQLSGLIQFAVESATLWGKNETPVQLADAGRLLGVGVLQSWRDRRRATALTWVHSDDHRIDTVNLLVFDGDDQSESEGSIRGSEDSNHESNPILVTAFQVSGVNVSTSATMLPLSAFDVSTRTQGGDATSRETDGFQSEKQGSDSCQASDAPQNLRAGKRSTRNHDQEDSDDGSVGNNARKKARNTPADEERPRLACPFYKLDPFKYSPSNLGNKYRVCAGPGYPSINRLKEHLGRVHRPIHCQRCLLTFESDEELVAHHKAAMACKLSSGALREGIDDMQWSEIKQKGKKNQSEIERWFRIWEILFPSMSIPPHPWHIQEVDNSNINIERILTIFDRQLELERSRGDLSLPLGPHTEVLEQFKRILRDSIAIATSQGPSMVPISEDKPSAEGSAPVNSEPTGSATVLPDPSVLSLNPKESLTISSEPLQPDDSAKTLDYSNRTSWVFTQSGSLDAGSEETMLNSMNYSENRFYLPQQISSVNPTTTTTEDQLRGSSLTGIPKDMLEDNPARGTGGSSEGTGSLVCSSCKASFKRASDRTRHEVAIHGIGARTFLCPIAGCPKSTGAGYSRADKVTEHLWKKHGNLGFSKR